MKICQSIWKTAQFKSSDARNVMTNSDYRSRQLMIALNHWRSAILLLRINFDLSKKILVFAGIKWKFIAPKNINWNNSAPLVTNLREHATNVQSRILKSTNFSMNVKNVSTITVEHVLILNLKPYTKENNSFISMIVEWDILKALREVLLGCASINTVKKCSRKRMTM